MANFYYNGGDRDDVNNYSASNWKKPAKNVTTPISKPETVKFIIPDCFDEDFYIKNREKFSNSSLDYWEWTKFLRFSNAVYSFYRQMSAEFYSNYTPIKPIPEFIDLKLKKENLDDILTSINYAENQLIEQFDKSRRTLKAKVNTIKPLKEVVNYAATAWIMYFANTENLYIKNSINFKNKYAEYDFENDLDILKAYRGCVVMKYLTSKVIDENLITEKINRSNKIYGNIDAEKLTNQLLETVGGFTTYDYNKIQEELLEKLENLNPEYDNLVWFYKNYIKMQETAKKVQEITENNKLLLSTSFEVDGENLYEKLAEFYVFALNLLDDESLDDVFKQDLNIFAKKLGKITKESRETYLQTQDY